MFHGDLSHLGFLAGNNHTKRIKHAAFGFVDNSWRNPIEVQAASEIGQSIDY